LRERKARVLAEAEAEKLGKGLDDDEARDLLSVLIKANMDTELPDAQRMTDEDIVAQIPTLLAAGHETTSTSVTWALYALAQQPALQKRLRDELQSVPTDTPTMDELASLSLLDAVVRETLRVHSAVPNTMRVAVHDDVIPLADPFIDRNGKEQHSVRVQAGDVIFVSILALNRSKEIWGEDALEFNADRWTNVPEAANAIPGVWGNTLTFLGGARSCIGYRFALVEMKALLFTLLRAFEFEMAFPPEAFEKRSLIVTRPYLRSDPKGGAQLPLIVKPVGGPHD